MNLEEESEINVEALGLIKDYIRGAFDPVTSELIINTVDSMSQSQYISTQIVVNIVKKLLDERIFGDVTSICYDDGDREIDEISSFRTLNNLLVETNVRVCPTESYLEVLQVQRIF